MQIYDIMQAQFEVPCAQEDALGCLDIPMNRDDPPEVMMVHLEQEQLFLLTHSEGGHRMTGVQMIHLAVEKLRACGPFYGSALSVWHGKDTNFCRHWVNFRTAIHEKYGEMLA